MSLHHDVFEGFAGHLFMKKGEKQGFTEFKVKNDLAKYPISGTITAYVRGYKINAAERPIVVSDKHYTILSLKNNSDNTVKEYGSFILVATVGASAKEDVVVHIDAGEDADKYENLPSELVVKAGYKTAESELIWVKGEKGPNTFTSVSMSFATDSEIHPVYGDKLEIKVTDTDAGLTPGTELTNEQWVYTDPDQIFVSANNKKAVEKWDEVRAASALLIKEGDPHPNEALAAEGWTFLNSYEFHPIDALTEGTGLPNQYGNRPPRFMAAQNVANTQKVQAVVNEKYATMTQDGYLKMWCAYDPGISVTGEITGTRDFGVPLSMQVSLMVCLRVPIPGNPVMYVFCRALVWKLESVYVERNILSTRQSGSREISEVCNGLPMVRLTCWKIRLPMRIRMVLGRLPLE